MIMEFVQSRYKFSLVAKFGWDSEKCLNGLARFELLSNKVEGV